MKLDAEKLSKISGVGSFNVATGHIGAPLGDQEMKK